MTVYKYFYKDNYYNNIFFYDNVDFENQQCGISKEYK